MAFIMLGLYPPKAHDAVLFAWLVLVILSIAVSDLPHRHRVDR